MPDLQLNTKYGITQHVGLRATRPLKSHCAGPDAQGTETRTFRLQTRGTTHQWNPVGIEGAESHLGDELGAGEKQEVEVEEVSELAEEHLER